MFVCFQRPVLALCFSLVANGRSKKQIAMPLTSTLVSIIVICTCTYAHLFLLTPAFCTAASWQVFRLSVCVRQTLGALNCMYNYSAYCKPSRGCLSNSAAHPESHSVLFQRSQSEQLKPVKIFLIFFRQTTAVTLL